MFTSDVPDIRLDAGTQSYKNHSIGYHDANYRNNEAKEYKDINIRALENTLSLWFKFVR